MVDDKFLDRLGLEKGTTKLVNHKERGRVFRAMDGCSYKAATGGSLLFFPPLYNGLLIFKLTLFIMSFSLKYVALNMLMRAIIVDTQAVQRHRATILECVKEKINSMRLTATSQGSVVNDCNVAEKLSHSSALGVKRKDLNGSTSSGQGCYNKDYMSDEDLEEHLRKMKAKSAEMLKKLSEKRYQLLQTYGKSFIPTV
ncbi:hypothetical protein CsSME_00007914 [Camellia sinensis var. sinensis]